MNLNVSIDINATKAGVWTAITDITHCQQMISGIKDLTIISQPSDTLVGLKWRETREMFGKDATETMWITEYKAEEYYCTRAENCGAIYLTKMSLTSNSDNQETSTVLTMSFSSSADKLWVRALSAIMGIFIKKSMVKMIRKDLEDIKRFIEAR